MEDEKKLKRLRMIRKPLKRKKKICAYCGKEVPIFRYSEKGPQCKNCVPRTPIPKKKKNKMTSGVQSSEDRLDQIVSTLVRKLAELPNGLVPCYTCTKLLPIAEMQCGHFIPRANHATRWLLDNLRPQCQECNEHKMGNLLVFAAKLDKEHPGMSEQLRLLANQISKPTGHDIHQMTIHYRGILKTFMKRK